jgi:hypothetical protein
MLSSFYIGGSLLFLFLWIISNEDFIFASEQAGVFLVIEEKKCKR